MTVKELIAELQKYDDDMIVERYDYDSGPDDIEHIEYNPYRDVVIVH